MSALHYVDPDRFEAGGSASWGDLWTDPNGWTYSGKDRVPFTTIDYATGSDYSGDLVNRSNYEVILGNDELRSHVVALHGGHGTYGVGYFGTPDNPPEELRETLDSLASYPLLDEQDYSEREMVAEGEAWDDYGRRDFAKELAEAVETATGWDYSEYVREVMPPGDLYEIWRNGCDTFDVNGGSGYVVETGGGVHFYIDEWIERATREGHLVQLACEWAGAHVPGDNAENDLAITDGLCLAGNVFVTEDSNDSHE